MEVVIAYDEAVNHYRTAAAMTVVYEVWILTTSARSNVTK